MWLLLLKYNTISMLKSLAYTLIYILYQNFPKFNLCYFIFLVAPKIDPGTATKLIGIAGEGVTMMCPATGDPKPEVNWSKLGTPLSK